MIEIYKKSEFNRLQQETGFNFSKALGQNFLTDRNIIEKIVDGAGIDESDVVIEIGAGAGALTSFLSARAKKVYAVEIDSNVIPLLERVTEGLGNVEIINQDFLKYDFDNLSENYKIIGNLPYYITTPIIAGILEKEKKYTPKNMAFMMQKEVAERLLSLPGKKTYGAISVLVQYYCDVALITEVSKEVFIPKPKVDSAVLLFTPKNLSNYDENVSKYMFKIVKSGFCMRRKTLRNSLKSLGVREDILLKAMEIAGIDPIQRAETLSVDDYYSLAKNILGLTEKNKDENNR